MSKRHPYSLIGIDGNAFSIMAYTTNAMKQCGYSRDAIQCYKDEAMSGDYDHLLSTSCMMVDNCNKLSGFGEFQQLMKGHDDLDYVDYPHCGTQNRTEQLIDESFDPFDPWGDFDDEEKSSNLDFNDEEDNSDDEYYQSNDYSQLYSAVTSSVRFVLNNHIEYEDEFKKGDVKQALMDILNDKDFWYDLDQEIPEKRLNEDLGPISDYLKYDIQSILIQKLNDILEDGVKFSKYDLKHAFLQLINSYQFWNSLDKYIEE